MTISHKAKSKDSKSGTIHAKDKKKVKEDTAAMTKDEGAGSGKRYEDKTRDDHLENKSHGEVTSLLRRLLNKYEEGKNRYQTLRRMMDSRTYLINGAGQDKKVQDKDKADAELNSILQVKMKEEEQENSEKPDDGNASITSSIKGGDRNEGNRIEEGDRIKGDRNKDANANLKTESEDKSHGTNEVGDKNKGDRIEGGDRIKDGDRIKGDRIKGANNKGKGMGRGEGNSYLLANPRLVEAPDDGTIAHPTGADRSAPGTYPEPKTPHTQNLTGGASQVIYQAQRGLHRMKMLFFGQTNSSGIVHHGVTKMFEGLKARDGNKVTCIDRY